jgi:predicted 3-demethylubiquinone-9 3-methyltransferase (glyoxalase superfamily)
MRYAKDGPGAEGSLMSASFELEGQEFRALNGGPSFSFAQGISLFVNCETQAEVDELWERLSSGGKEDAAAGLPTGSASPGRSSPRLLGEMLSEDDPKKSKRVLDAMLRMDKLDLAALQRAHESV